VKEIAQIFIDPSYPEQGNNRLFDASDELMNRDGQMLAFVRLKLALEAEGIKVNTADFLSNNADEPPLDYWSLGMMDKLDQVSDMRQVNCIGFIIFEPPLIAPHLYAALPQLTRQFERVYVHNIHGDGYSLKEVDVSRLRKLFWPQPFEQVHEAWARTDRMNKAVVIAGRHTARQRRPEYYSKRIEAMTELARLDAVDLYGRGWSQLWSAQTISWPYLRNFMTLKSIYRGPCRSKMEVLGSYNFSLCLENMPMQGYITEKIFDCFYAGTIPMYLGAPDIERLVPPESYIDIRNFDGWRDLWKHASHLSEKQMLAMRECGRDFISSDEGKKYVHSLENIFLE
jgi:alpha(1,3/1,4) fucosyltransferase